MDELEHSRQRLEKLREELRVAERKLKPLRAAWEERAEREADELFSFAKERGHFWSRHEETADLGRRMLRSVAFGAGRDVDGPYLRAAEKVERLEGKVRWWENKVRREEWEAAKARRLADR